MNPDFLEPKRTSKIKKSSPLAIIYNIPTIDFMKPSKSF